MELIQAIDNAVTLFTVNYLQNPFLDTIFAFISALGNKGMIWIVLGISFLAFRRTRKAGCYMLMSMLLAAIITNLIVKPLVARPRPYDLLNFSIIIEELKDFSFPSGHTTAAFAAAYGVKNADRSLGIIFTVFAFLMAASRLYLGVHFLTDIVAGALVGIASAWVIGKLIKE